MRHPTFMVPRVRGHGHLLQVRASSEVGIVNDWLYPKGAGSGTLGSLLRRWSGLLCGLALAGYRVVEIFVEESPATATRRLLLDPASLGFGLTDLVPDELGVARSGGAQLLAGITLEPMRPFGEAVGAPLAIPLPKERLEAVAGVYAEAHTGARGWLGFTTDDPNFSRSLKDLVRQGLDVGAVLVDAIIELGWYETPNALREGAGLGWIFDRRNWWFPPWAPGETDADSRLLGEALGAVADELTMDTTVLAEFLVEQVVRPHEPDVWRRAGSFGRLTNAFLGQPPGVAVEAYRRRAMMLAGAELPEIEATAAALQRHFMWSDALLAMIEHGAIGVQQHLLPGQPSTGAPGRLGRSQPEWTAPHLTGQWDAVGSNDTLILNQAGSELAGFWQRRGSMGGLRTLTRHVVWGTRTGDATLLEFTAGCWDQPNNESWIYDRDALGPPRDAGTTLTLDPNGGAPRLLLHVDLGGGYRLYTFTRNHGFAFHTLATLFRVPQILKDRIVQLRDAPLHLAETEAVVVLCTYAVKYVNRFLEEEPNGLDLMAMMGEFTDEVSAGLGELTRKQAQNQPAELSELLLTARLDATARLARVGPRGGESYYGILTILFKQTVQTSRYLQSVYGLEVAGQGAQWFRWRLREIRMIGAGYGAGAADGTAAFDLQAVDETHVPIGPVISRTIDITTTEVGAVYGPMFGLSDTGWQYFYPTMRDITTNPEHLDGATLQMFGLGASALLVESNSSVEVWFQPDDDFPPLRGRIDGALVKFALSSPAEEGLDPDEVYERTKKAKDTIKDLVDSGKKFLKEGLVEGVKSLKKPEVKATYTFGWLRTAEDEATMPEQPEAQLDDYWTSTEPWARFETERYELTSEFRDRLRRMLLWHLIMFRGTNDLTIEGHASQAGGSDYNYRLSRDRAMSVLTAMFDILGPQLAIAFGDIRVVAWGDERARGDESTDYQWDRRVDAVIGGRIRVRS